MTYQDLQRLIEIVYASSERHPIDDRVNIIISDLFIEELKAWQNEMISSSSQGEKV